MKCPELTPDNNSQERLIKTAILASESSMFASVEDGARSWVLIHSILQTTAMNGLYPTTYLKMLLDKVAEANYMQTLANDKGWDSVMPWNFKPEEIEKVRK